MRQAEAQEAYTLADLSDLNVSHSYTDERLGITYVYLQQAVGTLPIRGAIASIGMRDGKVYSANHRFVDDVAGRLESVVAKLNDEKAIGATAAELNISEERIRVKKDAPSGNPALRRYEAAGLTQSTTVRDYIMLTSEGKLRRALGVAMTDPSTGIRSLVSVDAANGSVLTTEKITLSCTFDHDFLSAPHHDGCGDEVPEAFAKTRQTIRTARQPITTSTVTTTVAVDESSYRVFPWPAESPSHGEHELVESPADAQASPFGWHDTDGAAGPEFTITRGNNVHAYLDQNEDNEPSAPEPDGGEALNFDEPFSSDLEPAEIADASVINLFYAINQIHDLSWHYGFDEAAGNFQQTNYTNEGLGNDFVLGQAQNGGLSNEETDPPTPRDGEGCCLNNANFGTDRDGESGVMQMFLWNRNNVGEAVTIAGPAAALSSDIGALLGVTGWGAGASVSAETNVQGQVVDVNDGVPNALLTDGCEPLINEDEVAGRIALIDRGTCEFGSKALRAQESGAVGVIICNFDDEAVGLGPGADGVRVNIPTFSGSSSTCATLRQLAGTYDDFELSIKLPDDPPTQFVAGSFDNGIIAHEYGHGISNRLTAGPQAAGCLGNDEQMGEGWSDFFTLVTAVRPGDTGETRRGIGTYASREDPNDRGIRRFPYSTDMVTNPVAYDDVADGAFSQPHGIGTVWASMLWDLYWNLVDVHGFDDDQFAGNGGNNKAILLVITGMKLQPCSPGFVDGRDAILAADALLSADEDSDYGASNEQLIWETFARRGLGFDADQGDSDNRFDQVASFEIPPALANDAFLTKFATPTINAGDTVEVRITLANWLDDPIDAAVITDALPAGALLIESSVTQPFEMNGDMLSFNLVDLSEGDSVRINYAYLSPAQRPDIFYIQDISEESDVFAWDSDNLKDVDHFFEVIDGEGFGDEFSWFVTNTDEESQPFFAMNEETEITVSEQNPILTFYTKYEINAAVEGGILEAYDPDGDRWVPLAGADFLRGSYASDIDYQSFVLPKLQGFTGSVSDWELNVIDLSEYAGQSLRLRFRYGRGSTVGTTGEEGWHVDRLAAMNLIAWNPTAKLLIEGRDEVLASAPDLGTMVINGFDVSSNEEITEGPTFSAYPNPTADAVNILLAKPLTESGVVEVYSATGQVLSAEQLVSGQARLRLSLGHVPAGLYTIRVRTAGLEAVTRLVKQ